MVLTAPRYALRELPVPQQKPGLTCGVFDSFTQEFVSGPNSQAQAERDARAANRAYDDGRNVFLGAAE